MPLDQPGPLAPKLPLMMLSGTLCDSRLFAPLQARLPVGRPILTRDPVGAASVRELATRALADAPPRFALLGFSLGGLAALAMAAQAPDRLAGLALVASSARPVPPDQHAARRDAVARARSIGLAALVQQELWPSYASPASRADAAMRLLVVDMAEAIGVDAYPAQVEAAIGRADSRPMLPGLRMPVLALCGGDDMVCTVEMHREIAGLAPDAILAIIPAAGHMVPLEAPDAMAGHVAAWLARVDETCRAGQGEAAGGERRWREHA